MTVRTFGPLPPGLRDQLAADIERILGPHAPLFRDCPKPATPEPLTDTPDTRGTP